MPNMIDEKTGKAPCFETSAKLDRSRGVGGAHIEIARSAKQSGRESIRHAFIVLALALFSALASAFSSGFQTEAFALDGDAVSTAPLLDGNFAYINHAEVVETIDGSAPFDADDDAGNDASESNGIVRSFDSISYDVEYSVDVKPDSPYSYFESGRIGIRAVLPYDDEDAEFAIEDMGWLDQSAGYKPKVTTETIDGRECQVFVGYRLLIPSAQNPTTIPGQGTVKLIVNVNGMGNGEKIKPEIQMFAEHNETSEYVAADAPETKVSAAPKYDIYLVQRESRSAGRGDYPFGATDSEYAIDKDAGDVNGAVTMYLLSFRIVNDSASKGMKGVEFPTSDYSFDLHFDSKVKAYDSSEWQKTPDDYAPKVWCWYLSGNGSFANSTQKRPINQAGQDWQSNELMPNGAGGPPNACLNSGTLTMNRTGLYDVSCTVSGMQYDYAKRPLKYNTVNTVSDNIFYLSSYVLMFVQPFDSLENGERITDRLGTSDCDFQVTVSDKNLRATTEHGTQLSIDADGVDNQSVKNNDASAMSLNVKEPGSFSAWGYYTRNYGITSGVDMKNWTYNYGNGYDALPIGYSNATLPLQIASGFGHGQHEDSQIPVYAETMTKFDDKLMSIGEVPDKPKIKVTYFSARDTSGWNATFQFGVKPDGSGWSSDDEQRKADWDDLIWYNSKEEAQKHGTIVAFNSCLHTPMDEYVWGSTSTATFMPMIISGDLDKVNAVGAMTVRSRYWTRGTLYDQVAAFAGKSKEELTFDDYQAYSDAVIPYTSENTNLPNRTSVYAHDTGFVKTVYGENGPISNQTGTSLNGDSLLLTAEQASISRTVSQRVGNEPKTIYDIDYGERYADIELRPSTSMSIAGADSSAFTTTVIITDKLPKGMSYVPGSCYMGGAYEEHTPDAGAVSGGTALNPQVSVNADGTTTLTWTLPGIVVNEPMEPIRYSALIGDQSDPENDVVNNQTLEGTATISSTYDRRQKHVNNGNLATYTIRVSKLRQSNLSIAVSPRFNELDADIVYTSALGNYGTNPIGDAYGICVLPNADNSSYSGDYSVIGLKLDIGAVSDASDIAIYATADAGMAGKDPNSVSLAEVESEWIRLEVGSDGTVSIPASLSHMTAWCAVKGALPEDERISVETTISTSGNSPKDSYTTTMSDGENTVRDSAYIVQRVLSGRVWLDDDANGAQDAGEEGFGGFTVSVLDSNGDVVSLVTGGKAVSDVGTDGTYQIAGLPQGSFTIRFRPADGTDLDGYRGSPANAQGVSDAVDSDAVPIYGADGWCDGGDTSVLAFPSIADMSSNVYAAEHVDFGMYPCVPGISLVKDVDKTKLENDAAVAGARLSYSFEIENTGNTRLENVDLEDPMLEAAGIQVAIDWESSTDLETGDGVLSAGERVPAKAVYSVTQGDVDALGIVNEAIASGETGYGEKVEDDDDATTVIAHLPSIALVKNVDKTLLVGDEAYAGEVLSYSFKIQNTGNATLDSVSLSDSLPGIAELSVDWDASSDKSTPAGTLSPGETVPAAARYSLKQSDVDAGSVLNTADVVGTSRQGMDVSDEADALTDIELAPAISLDKSTPSTSISNACEGYEVPFTFEIGNTGNVTLSDVSLADFLDGVVGLRIDWEKSTDAGTGERALSPGETVSATASYLLTQADVDRGDLYNPARTSGTAPNGEGVHDDDDVRITIDAVEDYLMSKSVDKELLEGNAAFAGELLTYSFDIRNTGERTLHGVKIDDALDGIEGDSISWDTHTDANTGVGTLSPDESATGTMTYVVKQSDIDAGFVENKATALAFTPSGEPMERDDDAYTKIVQAPSLLLEKTASTTRLSGADAVAGAGVEWFFTLTNTGNTTLVDITVEDFLDGIGEVDYGGWDRSLLPGASAIVSAPYTVTQADVDAGFVLNSAVAHSTAPGGVPVDSNESEAEIKIDMNGALVLSKDVDKTHLEGAEARPGTTLSYSFSVRNNGNVTLSNVDIEDFLEGASDVGIDWASSTDDATGEGALSPGEAVSASASYDIRQSDIDAGSVLNAAVAHSRLPGGRKMDSNEARVLTTIEQNAAISLVKDVDRERISPAEGGEVLSYSFLVRNEGNTTLRDVAIEDELEGLTRVSIDWTASSDVKTGNLTLSPGESVPASAEYRVSEEDVGNGEVVNAAIARGVSDTFPATEVIDEDDARTILEAPSPFGGVADEMLAKTGTSAPAIAVAVSVFAVASIVVTGLLSRRRNEKR